MFKSDKNLSSVWCTFIYLCHTDNIGGYTKGPLKKKVTQKLQLVVHLETVSLTLHQDHVRLCQGAYCLLIFLSFGAVVSLWRSSFDKFSSVSLTLKACWNKAGNPSFCLGLLRMEKQCWLIFKEANESLDRNTLSAADCKGQTCSNKASPTQTLTQAWHFPSVNRRSICALHFAIFESECSIFLTWDADEESLTRWKQLAG